MLFYRLLEFQKRCRRFLAVLGGANALRNEHFPVRRSMFTSMMSQISSLSASAGWTGHNLAAPQVQVILNLEYPLKRIHTSHCKAV